MKDHFKKLADLTTDITIYAKRELSTAQDTLDRTISSAVEIGKTSKEALVSSVDKSVELIQSAGETEFAKSVMDSAKNIAITSSEVATKLTDQLTELTTQNTPIVSELVKTSDDETVQLNDVIAKLKGKDKIGVAGEALAAVGGGAAGIAAASTLASAAGATTILGSSSLASVLGGTLVATTPVGWVIGAAVVAGAAGYGITKLVRSGSKQDQVREQLVKRLEIRLATMNKHEAIESPLIALNQLLPNAIEKGLISEQQAERMVSLIEGGSLNADIALKRIQSLVTTTA
jgi:hypothetical protein